MKKRTDMQKSVRRRLRQETAEERRDSYLGFCPECHSDVYGELDDIECPDCGWNCDENHFEEREEE